MKYINIIAEGSTEETYVNDALVNHFAQLHKYIAVRKIETGWDRIQSKPAKGGLFKYIKLRNDILRWIQSDRGKPDTWFSLVAIQILPTTSVPAVPKGREVGRKQRPDISQSPVGTEGG